MTAPAPRKGARRAADLPPEALAALNEGHIASATLPEILAIDQARLLRAAFPGLPAAVDEQARAACQLGIAARMARMGALLLQALGPGAVSACQAHASDTVRGWACFAIGAQELPLRERLQATRSLADDPHFGVREWAWLAQRPHLARELDAAIALLPARLGARPLRPVAGVERRRCHPPHLPARHAQSLSSLPL